MDYVDANGIRFAYLTQGSGPLVLLLHGFPDTAQTWDAVMPAVAAAGFRAVAPYLRGYHPSSIPADGRYDGETLGRDVLALIEALGEAQATVVGHDWGALAAYNAAALGPERVRLLVTLGVPHPRSVFPPTPKMLWNVRHFFPLRRKSAGETIRANNFAYVDELWRRWSPAWKSLPAAETDHVKRSLSHPGSAEAAASYYAALSPRMPPALKRNITVPSVAFAGLHDSLSPKDYDKAKRCFDGPYEVVRVPGGHFMHREAPAEFIAELTRVLRSPPT